VMDFHLHLLVILLFGGSLILLIGSLTLFLMDMQLSLKAVQFLLDDAKKR